MRCLSFICAATMLSAVAWAGSVLQGDVREAMARAKADPGKLPPLFRNDLDLLQIQLGHFFTDKSMLSQDEEWQVYEALKALGYDMPAPRGNLPTGSKDPKRPQFSTRATRVGKRSVGHIVMSVDGRVRTLFTVERPITLPQMQKQTNDIVTRLRTIDAADPNWWMRLDIAQSRKNGLTFVRHPKSPDQGIVVTADPPYAELSGRTVPELAGTLIYRMKTTFGRSRNVAARGGPDALQTAMDKRCAGDEVFAKDLKKAEALYLESIHADPSYPHAYERLASVCEERNDKKGAKLYRERKVMLADLKEILKSTDSDRAKIAAYRERLDLDPGAVYPYVLLMKAFRDGGDTESLTDLRGQIEGEKKLRSEDRAWLLSESGGK